MASREVSLRSDSIRLGQFLKLADVVDNGGDVKPLMIGGLVAVNGVPETRRGRTLVDGDVVTVGADSLRVVAAASPGLPPSPALPPSPRASTDVG